MSSGSQNLARCPHCSQPVRIPSAVAVGTVLRCPMCRNLFRAPAFDPTPTAPVATYESQSYPVPSYDYGGTGSGAYPIEPEPSPPPPTYLPSYGRGAGETGMARAESRPRRETAPRGPSIRFHRWRELASTHYTPFLGMFIVAAVIIVVAFVFGVAPLWLYLTDWFGWDEEIVGRILGTLFYLAIAPGLASMAVEQVKHGHASPLLVISGVRYLPSALVIEVIKRGPVLIPLLIAWLVNGRLLIPSFIAAILTVLYISLRLSFAIYFLVDLDVDVGTAVRSSWEVTESRLWPILGVHLFSLALFFAGALFCGIGLLFALPYIALLWAAGYVVLTGQSKRRERSW